jgi:hypothetical protein
MKKTIRLTESELINLVKRVINEQTAPKTPPCFTGFKVETTMMGPDRVWVARNRNISIYFDEFKKKWDNRYTKSIQVGKEKYGTWYCDGNKFIEKDLGVRMTDII